MADMATESNGVWGCGRHKFSRQDVQEDSAFDQFFNFDCSHCCGLIPRNPRLCDNCQKWNIPDNVFKTFLGVDRLDEPRTVADYMAHSYCMVCQVLLEAILESLRFPPDMTAADELKIVNCGPYHFESTVKDSRMHIVNLRARDGNGKCLFLLLVSPDASAFHGSRMSNQGARQGIGDECMHGAWKDSFLPVQVELKYEVSSCRLLEVRKWERPLLKIADLHKLIVEHETPPPDAMQGELPNGFRLIDTFEKRIVEPDPSSDIRFVTLSYTWSSSAGQPCEDLIKDRLNTMTKAGALKEQNYPYVIWDSIQLCQDLGERYLWTDRICILQDDPKDLDSQVAQMDRIYGRAILCITSVVNTQLDKGLPGVRGRPRRNPIENTTRCFSNDFATIEYDLEGMLDRSDWNTRGCKLAPGESPEVLNADSINNQGTLQERILSRQCLFISNFNWCFISGQTVYHEDAGELDTYFMHADTAGRRTTSDPYGIAVNSSDYLDLVAHYTRRRLTYKADILNAFAGIANIISKQQRTRYFFGLCEKYFLEGLLWGYGGTHGLSSDIHHIPSWSWAAWDGSVDYRSLFKDKSSLDVVSLGPMVIFHYSHALDGILELIQQKRWFGISYDGAVPDMTKLPSMYSRRESEAPEITTARWLACPHNPWTSIENLDLGTEAIELAKRFPGALLFKTTVASLPLRQELIGYNGTSIIFILSHRDQRVGHLMQGASEAWTATWLSPSKTYDFIVLSAGRPPSDDDRKGSKKREPEDPMAKLFEYEKYKDNEPLLTLNVMLVEKAKEGIWRRVAIGFVLMKHWASCEPRWEAIVLT